LLKEELDLVEAKRKIIDFIKKEATESRTDGVVLVLSGGIDSSVTAYLSVEALGARRVMGLIMPDLRVTPKQDLDDAKEAASELGMETRFIDIAPIHRTFTKNLEPDRLAEGNLLKVESRLGRGSKVDLEVSRDCPQEAATTYLQAPLRMLIHGKQSSWNLPGR